MEKFIFYALGLIMIGFAVASVTSRKMLRSVVYLLFVLIGVAGIYFMADYNFLAAIQLTVYAGGIVVLIIFSVLLIHHIDMELEVAKRSKRIMAALACLAGLGIFTGTLVTHTFNPVPNTISTTAADIGYKLLSYDAGGFILPFEVVSILLLAAMIGAIVIALGDKETRQEIEVISPGKDEKPEEKNAIILEKKVINPEKEVIATAREITELEPSVN